MAKSLKILSIFLLTLHKKYKELPFHWQWNIHTKLFFVFSCETLSGYEPVVLN